MNVRRIALIDITEDIGLTCRKHGNLLMTGTRALKNVHEAFGYSIAELNKEIGVHKVNKKHNIKNIPSRNSI